MSIRRLCLTLGAVMLVMVSFIPLTGCVGYVGPDGGGVYVAPAPVVIFGGDYGRGYDARTYSRRGAASRAAAHRR